MAPSAVEVPPAPTNAIPSTRANKAPAFSIPFNKALIMGGELENLQSVFADGDIKGHPKGMFNSKCLDWLQNLSPKSQVHLTTSGTAALEFAAMLVDIQPGDEIIVPSYTYVSSMTAFVLRGAKCVFVDIDPANMNMDASLIEAAITPKTKVIVPVHYSSLPCDMNAVMDVANRHNLLVVEDAACCMGSEFEGRPQGSIGHVGCFSFHATKPFTAGGQGGAILVNDPKLFLRAEQVYENGTDRRAFGRKEVSSYTVQTIGSNFQLCETMAACLWVQMQRADEVVGRRSQIWHEYERRLKPIADRGQVGLPVLPKGTTRHNGGQYWMLCKDGAERKRFMAFMKEVGIETQFHFQPLHASPFGQQSGRLSGEDKWATNCADRIVRFPIYWQQTDAEVDKVVERTLAFYANEPLPN